MKNKLLSILLTICMVALLLPVSATADGAVSYLYYENEAAAIAGTTSTGSCTDYTTVVTDQTAWGEAGQEKWYVVNSSVTISDRITVSGDVHLILVDSYTLTAPKGIGVATGNSLTIYGQSADESTMGALNAQLGKQAQYNYLAAIGGGGSQNSSGQITVNGGKIIATGGTNAAGIGGGKDESGTVTINGGFITATSQYNNATPGAAIGGGYKGNGTVTINGGHIVATGGQSAAGIGSGYAASATVTINGGSIEAHGGAGAAGIGSGKYWNDTSTTRQATVYIHGGTVTADTKSPTYNTDGSAAIGGGAYSQGFVTIDGGHVTATAPKNCTCIGNYQVCYRKTGSVTITGGVITAQLDSSVQASDTYYGIGGAECSVTLGWTNANDSITAPAWGKQGNNISPRENGVTFVDGKSFQYQDTHTLAEAASLRNGATLIPFTPAAHESVDQADVSGVRAWYPYTGFAIEPEPVVTYSGTQLVKDTDYTLSYTDDHTNLGEKAVTITGMGNYTGTKTIPYEIVEASTTYLDDTGASQTCPAFQCLDQSDTTLSGGWYLVYGDLTINDRISLSGSVNLILKDGTTLTAQKGISVPSSASLTIYAQSNSESTAGKFETGAPDVSYPGIGGPYQANTAVTPGNITIVGGVINVTGGVGAAAIGGASYSPGGNIAIKGGFVTAGATVGGGAAIGGGANADGGTITISGGTVTATGNGGAAIGGGSGGKSGTINISGGTVTATASGSAAIGGGSNGAGETINITGGTVTASSSAEDGGAAIGGGAGAAGGSITIQNATIAKAAANGGAGIGSGGRETTGTTTIIIGTGATITSATGSSGAGIGSGANGSATCSVMIGDGANVNAGSVLGAGIGGGTGASNFTVNILGGTVNAWASGSGVQDKEGNLSAYGGAAIGGGANTNGGTVNISGGTVTARAIGGGAGIGSGANNERNVTTDSGSITISGGNVTATATHRAAGIGGGRRSNGGNITISGGTIVANGSDAAGIGRGGADCLWEGQGNFYIPIVNDPTEETGGAYYDSIVQIAGTWITPTDGTVAFTYADGGTVSITASSYPASPTLDKDFMYSDDGTEVIASAIVDGKTIVPYTTESYTVTFAAGEGTGTMAIATVIRGTTYTLPDCTFTAPEGKIFKEWSVKIGDAEAVNKQPGDTITVTADTTVTALWKAELTDGYYLIGQNGWTVDALDPAQVFTVNPANANEYMLETTLAEGDEIKVVRVADGAIAQWFPDPGDNYTVAADYAGSVTIYFKTTYDNAWSAFGGHIWIEKKAPTFATQSLILSGQIGLSFNMDLPDIEGVDWTESYMTFTIPHGTCTARADYADSSAKKSGNRGFVCYVNAIQMAEPITATFHWTEGEEEKTIEKTYAIKDYFFAYDGKKDTFLAPVQKLIESTADYGHYVQAYLADVKGWTLGENGDYYEMDKCYTTAYDYDNTAAGLAYHGAFTCENDGADIKGLSFATVLDSATAIRLLITPTSGYTGTVTATVNNDKEVKVSKSGSRYIVEIPDLAAHELSKDYTITITTENGTATITTSALSYVKLLFNAYETTPVRNAASAILGYASAAYDFQYAD